MSKKRVRKEIVNRIATSIVHKIGSIVNSSHPYALKYSKEARELLEQASQVARKENWNDEDKKIIHEEVRRKVQKELQSRDFLAEKKFALAEQEIAIALTALNLS